MMEFRVGISTARETEIGGCLLGGLSTEEIAVQTGLSKGQIKAHIRNMERKLNAGNSRILKKLLKEQISKAD